MAECMTLGLGGGAKVYTEEDCEILPNTRTLQLPAGIVWSDIKYMLGVYRDDYYPSTNSFLKEVGGNGLGSTDAQNIFLNWSTPDPTATQLTINSFGWASLRYVVIIV